MASRLRPGRRAVQASSFLLATLVATCAMRDSSAAPDDPGARGLDAYIELPEIGVTGTTFDVNVRSFGFRTAVDPEPVGHVTVDAVWSEGDPTPVSVATDDIGNATLKLSVPEGKSEEVELAINLRLGSHARTRTFKVKRSPRHAIEMRLARSGVRPGSKVPVWVFVRDRSTGGAAGSLGVTVTLSEGGVVRQSVPLTTDVAGSATTMVSIPETEEPTLGWEVRAATNETAAADAVAQVHQVEEVPARPTLKVKFDARRVAAGAKTDAVIHLSDAADDPLEGASIHYLVFDKDHAPKKDEWEKSLEVKTDALGVASIPVEIPTVGFSKSRDIHVKTTIGGRDYESHDGLEIVAKAAPIIQLNAEGGYVIPGASQRLVVSAHDGFDNPISAAFSVDGDGLHEKVATDAHGRGEVTWKVPLDVGALRQVGPCSGSVAATVRVTAASDAPTELVAAGSVPVCIDVDREVGARAEIASPVVRAGDTVPISLLISDPKLAPKAKEKTSISLSASDVQEPTSALTWAPGLAGSLTLPETRGGVFRLTATLPRANGPAIEGSAMVLVAPRILPKLTMRLEGGRPTPGGEVAFEAKLTDETGAPLEGSVMGVVFDKTSIEPRTGIPPEFDTRLMLCSEAGVASDECDAVFAREPGGIAALRASMWSSYAKHVVVRNDPGGTSEKEMRETFNAVLKNLEGAVYEATSSPERLRDVLRKGTKGNEFNPEIMTLVTGVMRTQPTTPGGEPFTLDDLVAVDPQVDYDNVARRVSRLKLFNVLSAIRTFRNQEALDPNEPVLADPNGILRRLLVREDGSGTLDPGMLADPWGGTMQFVKGHAGGLPFISPVPGWELHVAGPDGKIGTGDDISDPFVRVVKSGSPYALAMAEDKIVDAKLDMRVADATVQAWSSLLTEFTGTSLGGGLGLSGIGEGGGGHAEGIGLGSIGTVGHAYGSYELSAPVRTDGHGVAHIRLPLGADETTYRVVLVAMPDKAGRAAAFTDVPTSLPLSVRVDGGEKWVSGDEPWVNVKVTNRSDAPVHATVKLAAEGAAALGKGESGSREIDIPKRHAGVVRVHVRATGEGEARLLASVSAGSAGSDSIDHRIDVAPRGRHVGLGRARWLTNEETIPLIKSDARTTLEGPPQLVLEASLDGALTGVLPTLEPDRITSLEEAADAAAAYERLARALAANHPSDAARAGRKQIQALGRFAALSAHAKAGDDPLENALFRRARSLADSPDAAAVMALTSEVHECPQSTEGSLLQNLATIEGEPPPTSGAVNPCWEAAASNAMHEAAREDPAAGLARIVLAFADRPHRKGLAIDAADALALRVHLSPSGEISLGFADARSARATVYAALVRATSIGWASKTPPETLLGWLLVQRAPDGGFGSIAATRAAVEALAGYPSPTSATEIRVQALDKDGNAMGVPQTMRVTATSRVALDPRATAVRLTVQKARGAASSGVLARIEQSALLGFRETLSQDDLGSPISAALTWPDKAVVDQHATLEVRFSEKAPSENLVLRIPLPPGASLAEEVKGVRQLEGALLVSTDRDSLGLPFEIPLRFGVAGDFTIPDTMVRTPMDPAISGLVPAARFHVTEK